MKNRQEEIRAKGFNMSNRTPTSYGQQMDPIEYNKIRVGVKNLDDAVLNLGSLKATN